MIFDANERLWSYGSGPLWEAVCNVVTTLTADAPDGEYDILGQDALYRVMEYPTKPINACRIEGHRVYIDIQFTLRGAEGINVYPASFLKSTTDYDADEDVRFYESSRPPLASVINRPGVFTLLFPHDLHQPQLLVSDEPRVRKAVVKLRFEAFNALRRHV